MREPPAPLSSAVPNRIGRRFAARLRLSIPAKLISIYDTHDCILLDLSQTGARIALEAPLDKVFAGVLKVGPLDVFGEVVRYNRDPAGGEIGIAFETSLSLAAVLAVRHHAETLEQKERRTLRDQARRWVTGEKPELH